MAYTKQIWTPNVTPVDAAHMNHIEDGLAAAAGGVFTDYQAVSAPSTDLPWLGGTALSTFIPISDASGTLGTLGVPTGDDGTRGTRATLINWSGAPLTILFGAAGAGAKFWFQKDTATDYVMQPNECLEFVFDGVWWDQVFTSYPDIVRTAAGNLKAVGDFHAGGSIYAADGSAANQILLGSDGKIYFSTAGDTILYRAAAGVVRTGAISTSAYGTTLPVAPVDGQEFTLVDSVTNPSYQWRFRYNAGSTSAYKWEFVGGSPANYAWANFTNTTGGSTWVWADSVTLPRAGDWDVAFMADMSAQPAILGYLTFGVGGSGAAWAPGGPHVSFPAGSEQLLNMIGRVSVPAPGSVLQIGHLMTAQPMTFGQPYVKYQPVRVA